MDDGSLDFAASACAFFCSCILARILTIDSASCPTTILEFSHALVAEEKTRCATHKEAARPPAFTTVVLQSTALVATVFVLQQCNTSITDSTRCSHVQCLPPCLPNNTHWLDVFICQSLWGGILSHVNSQPVPTLQGCPHQSDHQTLPPPSTLPFSVHRLHFLTEVTLPQEQTRVLWVPA